MSMNTQRITISLPDYIYDQLIALYGRGKVSRFISQAAEKELMTKKIEKQTDPVEEFLNFTKNLKLPKMTDRQIKQAINKGRA
ncbi:hypothetical protein KKH13_02620 [Patescibacteria group bacterium]|nr:hypothetical protein [Patescibacteria group bacterium]